MASILSANFGDLVAFTACLILPIVLSCFGDLVAFVHSLGLWLDLGLSAFGDLVVASPLILLMVQEEFGTLVVFTALILPMVLGCFRDLVVFVHSLGPLIDLGVPASGDLVVIFSLIFLLIASGEEIGDLLAFAAFLILSMVSDLVAFVHSLGLFIDLGVSTFAELVAFSSFTLLVALDDSGTLETFES